MIHRVFTLCSIALGFWCPITAQHALAQKFPEKPVTLVLTAPPGGPIDTLARVIGAAVSGTLGQPVIIENRPGISSHVTMLGVPQYVGFENLKLHTGIDTLAVPYAGAAPVVTAMLGGQIDATIFNAAAFAEPARAGKIRALATTAARRIALMPDVPTLAEAGFPKLKTGMAEGRRPVGPYSILTLVTLTTSA